MSSPPPDETSKPAAKSSEAEKDHEKEEEEEEGTLECSKCGENCWRKGWFLEAEEGETERKSLCDDCFLVCPNISGADRCLMGKVKVIPKKKDKKPKAAKGKATKAKH